MSCLGPAATQLQSQQAAGLKDRLVLQPVGDTLGHVCVVRKQRSAEKLVFLPEALPGCPLLRSSPLPEVPSLHSCKPFPLTNGECGQSGGRPDQHTRLFNSLLCLLGRRNGSRVQNKTYREGPSWLLPWRHQLGGPANLADCPHGFHLRPSL